MNAIRVPKAKFKSNMRPFVDQAKGGKIVIVTHDGAAGTNGNATIFALAESVFLAAATATPPAPAASRFFCRRPGARPSPGAAT